MAAPQHSLRCLPRGAAVVETVAAPRQALAAVRAAAAVAERVRQVAPRLADRVAQAAPAVPALARPLQRLAAAAGWAHLAVAAQAARRAQAVVAVPQPLLVHPLPVQAVAVAVSTSIPKCLSITAALAVVALVGVATQTAPRPVAPTRAAGVVGVASAPEQDPVAVVALVVRE